MNFLNWVTYYNYLNAGLALRLFLPNKKTIELPATKSFYFSEKKIVHKNKAEIRYKYDLDGYFEINFLH